MNKHIYHPSQVGKRISNRSDQFDLRAYVAWGVGNCDSGSCYSPHFSALLPIISVSLTLLRLSLLFFFRTSRICSVTAGEISAIMNTKIMHFF